MRYFKWRAYGWDLKYHTGVVESDSPHKAIFKIIKRGLVPAELTLIEYNQYKRELLSQTKLDKLYNLRKSLTKHNRDDSL